MWLSAEVSFGAATLWTSTICSRRSLGSVVIAAIVGDGADIHKETPRILYQHRTSQ